MPYNFHLIHKSIAIQKIKSIVSLTFVLVFISSCQYGEQDLASLQKKIFVTDKVELNKKIDQGLERYYLNLDVPDSLKLVVQRIVVGLIDTSDIRTLRSDQIDSPNQSYYETEHFLKSEVKTILIARLRNNSGTFNDLLKAGKRTATYVDKQKGGDYWTVYFEQLAHVDSIEAHTWLLCESAERLCLEYINDDQHWQTAEYFAAYGLQLAKNSYDPRLELDLWQSLLWIVFFYHKYPDLSIWVSEQKIKIADQIKYQHRKVGLMSQCAEANYEAGELQKATKLYEEVIRQTLKHRKIPGISWYEYNGKIMLANCFWQRGYFDKSIQICNGLGDIELNDFALRQLSITKGITNAGLGNYEQAMQAYNMGLFYARKTKSVYNEIIILNNIAEFYERISEFDQALDYFDKAINLIEEFHPENYALCDIYLYKARLLRELNKKEQSLRLIEKAAEISKKRTSIPSNKADLLLALGGIYLDMAEYDQSLFHLQQADSIYEKRGLMRKSLAVKLLIAKNLIYLNNYEVANRLITQTLPLAQKMQNFEKIINCTALRAELEFQKGNIAQAVSISNKLLKTVENMSARFSDPALLTAYRQKIYDYIKSGVYYELAINRVDSAFVKLEYAKARELKKYAGGATQSLAYMDLKKLARTLPESHLLIDYLIYNNTLYAFVLFNGKLEIFSREMGSETLRQKVTAYTSHIKNTIDVFGHYRSTQIKSHFQETIKISHDLFQTIMGWEKLQTYIAQSDYIYIIPDEILFDIPFSTLVVESTDSVSYLIHKAAIVYLPSSAWVYSESQALQKESINTKEVVFSADRSFEGSAGILKKVKGYFPRTREFALQEGKTYREIVENTHSDIYIIIGHGTANRKYPAYSKIDFTFFDSETNRYRQKPFSIAELNNMHWANPDLVLLIGCETAAGKVYRSTGLAGLQHCFLRMGAKSVLASLWQIDEKYALNQTDKFLRLYYTGEHPAQILKQVQISTINELRENKYFGYAHPYFWGSV